MKVVGLMSGTSADGVDAGLYEITGAPPHLRVELIAAQTRPYGAQTRQRILAACQPETGRVDDLCRLNFQLGELFSAVVLLDLIQPTGIQPDLIGSHGQTVWHTPADGATLQITEAAVIAERTGITTISNFRARDLAAGGQGAPLTAYADWLLLRHESHWRAIQNIGGIANVTLLPPLCDRQSAPIAFDTGPGNVLIDAAVERLTEGGQTYDRDGELARRGTVDEKWLAELLAHPYYRQVVPKTTGREVFGAAMASDLVATGRQRGLKPESIIATLTALTAASIAVAYERFSPVPLREVILGGGGARNPILVETLRERVQAHVLAHEDIGLDSDFKEALVFALLAYETWHGRPGTLPALTGAPHPTVLGQITPGENYQALVRKTWC